MPFHFKKDEVQGELRKRVEQAETTDLLVCVELYERSSKFRCDVAVVKAELAKRQERENATVRRKADIGLVVAVAALFVSLIALFTD